MNNWIGKYGSKILSALGIIGVGATAVLAVKATPAAMQHIAEAEAEEPIDKVRACWKDYIPAVTTGLGTMICIGSAQFLNDRQIKNLTGGLAALEGMFEQYREHNRNINGKETDDFIMRQMQRENEDEDDGMPPWDELQHFIIIFENDVVEFEATMQEVVEAEYKINRLFQLKGTVTVNDFLDFLHLKHIPDGDKIGWDQYIGETVFGYQWIDFYNDVAKEWGDAPYLVREIVMPFMPHSFDEEELGV